MKLNNHGWGLSVFLGFVALFVLCIIIASINAYNVGLTKESTKPFFESEVPTSTPKPSSSNSKYETLQENLIRAATYYKNERYPDLAKGSTVYVSGKNLLEKNYISSLENCSGYVRIQEQSQTNYTAFLKCPDYVSDGYDEKLDKNS